MSLTVVMVGAGNVATHISKRLASQGFEILQVYSRTEESARLLADGLSTEWTTDPDMLNQEADFYFLALKDSVLADFLDQSGLKDKLLLHCSGSLNISILAPFSNNYGVIYPLQTFSKSRDVNLAEIPVFIESSDAVTEMEILRIAESISNCVRVATSGQRMQLHMAAVFACNFVNHMYAVAEGILEKSGFGFEYLETLIRETFEKALTLNPKEAQTGPAVRNDRNIVEKHLQSLEYDASLRLLYERISQHISTFHKK